MNNTTKILIASFIILACSIGFFAGSVFMNPNMPCKRNCPMVANGFKDCPRMNKGENPLQHGEKFRHHKKFKKHENHDFHRNMEKNIAEMDSVMQVTPSQKEALNANRVITDSTFKILGSKKKEADWAFRDALESGDTSKINVAKAQILAAEEAILIQRAASFAELAKILSPEQCEKFQAFRKAKFEKFQKR